MYYKDSLGNLYFKPSIKLINKKQLIETDKENFERIIADINKQTKESLFLIIESIRDKFFSQGVPYNDAILHGGNKSAIDIKVLGIDLVSAGAAVPVWKVKKGGNIENPTLEQLTEMLTAVATNVGIGYKAEDIVKQQIFVLSDEEISNFDVENAFNNAVQLISSLQSDESASSIS